MPRVSRGTTVPLTHTEPSGTTGRPGDRALPWDVADFCQVVAHQFATGDLEGLAEHHAVPLVVYLPGGLRIRMTRDEISAALGRRRKAAQAAGMADIKVSVCEILEARRGRLPIQLEWSYLDGSGHEIGRNRMRHYCRREPDGRLLIEMVEIIRLAFPVTSPP